MTYFVKVSNASILNILDRVLVDLKDGRMMEIVLVEESDRDTVKNHMHNGHAVYRAE